ncbi:hypothetical protein M885DRAFT_611776 [Pelagophyceae sp. CCMP2097]|nr:hypothetical protein M885DRAFT_611776 [Pelagophyceae sp. CCMP2097]
MVSILELFQAAEDLAGGWLDSRDDADEFDRDLQRFLPLPNDDDLRPDATAFTMAKIPGKGLGLVSARDLPAGTTLFREKPIAMVRDDDDDGDEDDDEEDEDDDAAEDNRDGARLILLIARRLKKAEASSKAESWTGALARLHPRTPEDTSKLKPWTCSDAKLGKQVSKALAGLSSKRARALLPLVVRHNALDVRTGGELFSHPMSNLQRLGGLALYAGPSLFNHSDQANVHRWHCGDVGIWRTNQDVAAGEELAISYVESDLLNDATASPLVRRQLRHFEFEGASDSSEFLTRLLDDEVESELRTCFTGRKRLKTMKRLAPQMVLKCDCVQLGVVLAHTRTEMGQADKAAEAWAAVVKLATKTLPSNDERLVVYRTSHARAAFAHGDFGLARRLLKRSAKQHDVIFGGGAALYRHRHAPDVALDLGDSVDAAQFWKLCPQ